MLMLSMTARAEDGSSSSSTSSTSSQRICPNVDEMLRKCQAAGGTATTFEKEGCKRVECRNANTTTTQCPNIDEMIRKCTANGMGIKRFPDAEHCPRVECVKKEDTSSSSSSCPDATQMWNRCMTSGGTPTSFVGDNGCKMVKCANSSTSTSTGGGSVDCKKTVKDKCNVYTCTDGTVERVCGNSQDKPKPLPTAPKGPCTDIERAIIEVKAALEKDSANVDLQKKLNELTTKFAVCRANQGSASSKSSSSVGGTSTAACETKLVNGCKVTTCRDGRSFKVCS